MKVLERELFKDIYAQNSALYLTECPDSIELSRRGLRDYEFDECSQQRTEILSNRSQHPIQSLTRPHKPDRISQHQDDSILRGRWLFLLLQIRPVLEISCTLRCTDKS